MPVCQAVAERREQGAVLCPRCGSGRSYRLSDGRLMCKRCRSKFTPAYQVGRLDEPLLRGLAAHFWHMTPTTAAGGELGIDRKTVQRYYRLLRRRLARESEALASAATAGRELAALFLGELSSRPAGVELRDTVTVFGMLQDGGFVRLVFTPWSDWSGLDLASIRPAPPPALRGRPALAEAPPEAAAFWRFARTGLRRYRGGFLSALPVFLREMEFRYNHRHDPGAVQLLLELLTPGPL